MLGPGERDGIADGVVEMFVDDIEERTQGLKVGEVVSEGK